MKKALYREIESFMKECMKDSAHDKEHIYRVLYMALDIAEHEDNVDREVLIIACLLHDIGREEQFRNPKLCHAKVGSEKAFAYLIEKGFREEKAANIRDCILTHRYRNDNPPKSMEAKILFDADKLDVSGTLGIARTLIYQGIVSHPIYSVADDGTVLDGTNDTEESFFCEYKYKLEKLYDIFYTKRAGIIAKERQLSAINFYNNMLKDVRDCYTSGNSRIKDILE